MLSARSAIAKSNRSFRAASRASRPSSRRTLNNRFRKAGRTALGYLCFAFNDENFFVQNLPLLIGLLLGGRRQFASVLHVNSGVLLNGRFLDLRLLYKTRLVGSSWVLFRLERRWKIAAGRSWRSGFGDLGYSAIRSNFPMSKTKSYETPLTDNKPLLKWVDKMRSSVCRKACTGVMDRKRSMICFASKWWIVARLSDSIPRSGLTVIFAARIRPMWLESRTGHSYVVKAVMLPDQQIIGATRMR